MGEPYGASSVPSSRDAAHSLAWLIERQLGLSHGTINPVALRLFLVAYWDRVSLYAHAIHNDDEKDLTEQSK
jgi:hypothetical protein